MIEITQVITIKIENEEVALTKDQAIELRDLLNKEFPKLDSPLFHPRHEFPKFDFPSQPDTVPYNPFQKYKSPTIYDTWLPDYITSKTPISIKSPQSD